MPVQELIEDLRKVGEEYPEKSTSIIEKFRIWDKHDNQPVANHLKLLRTRVSESVPEKLQEAQLLSELVKIINHEDFVSSTKLITDIKKALSQYPSFVDLDKYLPEGTNKECPTIINLRNALTQYAAYLHLQYGIEKSVNEAEAEKRGKLTP